METQEVEYAWAGELSSAHRQHEPRLLRRPEYHREIEHIEGLSGAVHLDVVSKSFGC
jgi:hypothetical protein